MRTCAKIRQERWVSIAGENNKFQPGVHISPAHKTSGSTFPHTRRLTSPKCSAEKHEGISFVQPNVFHSRSARPVSFIISNAPKKGIYETTADYSHSLQSVAPVN